MADIFVSYSRSDQDTAKLIADALTAQGWSVWWDPDILYGTQYDKVIEDEIGRARCVVVLWSKRSAGSRWVRAEASKGVERGTLVPVRIEADANVPLEFTKIQTADLSDWDGDRQSSTFMRLARSIERLIGSGSATGQEGSPQLVVVGRSSETSSRRRRFVRLGLLAAPTVVALTLAVIATQVHRPTAFDLDLAISGLSFVSAADKALLLDKTAFTALDVHGIAKGTITAARAELVKEIQAVPRVPGSNASPPPALPLKFTQGNAHGAAVHITASGGGLTALGELDRLFLEPKGKVEIDVFKETPPKLSVRIWDQPSVRLVLWVRGESMVEFDDARIEADTGTPFEASTLILRLAPADTGAPAEMFGAPTGPTVILTPEAKAGTSASLASGLRVSALEFQSQGPTGTVVTTVSGDGTIGFPEAEGKAGIDVKAGHYVVLRDLDSFFIRTLTFKGDTGTLHLQAGGTAASLRSGPAGGVGEHALTWFEWVRHQPWSLHLFGLAAWLFPTTIAGYRLLKELRK